MLPEVVWASPSMRRKEFNMERKRDSIRSEEESVWNTSSIILDTDVNLEHRRRLFGTFPNDTLFQNDVPWY